MADLASAQARFRQTDKILKFHPDHFIIAFFHACPGKQGLDNSTGCHSGEKEMSIHYEAIKLPSNQNIASFFYCMDLFHESCNSIQVAIKSVRRKKFFEPPVFHS